jgi:hypothetical protein
MQSLTKAGGHRKSLLFLFKFTMNAHNFVRNDDIIIYNHKMYRLSDDIPKDGDMVLTENYGIWEYKKAPCPIPYWGNPNNCKKMVHIEDL